MIATKRPFLTAICGLCVSVLCCASGWAQTHESRTADDSLNSLSWLTGYWSGESGGTQMEEFWLPPDGRMMVGLHRDVFAEGNAFFEYLRIESTEEGVVYFASPKGRAATPFKLVEMSAQQVTFENKEHDFPQRIKYWLAAPDILGARIEGMANGKLEAIEWQWRRSSPPGGSHP